MLSTRTILLAGAGVTVISGIAAAQFVVTDPALTFKDAVIATLAQEILGVASDQTTRLYQMVRRLSALTDLSKYGISDDDTPQWRIHVFWGDEFLYANDYNAALNYGDRYGDSFEEVARSRQTPGTELTSLAEGSTADIAILAELATLDAADSTLIASTDQAGLLRYNGRKETAAIEALETDALDPSLTQGTTAVLEKISGAGLIRARQQQARIQFLTGIVEQLLVDNKRSRDTETAAMNMQIERLLYGRTAGANLIAGAAGDLRGWIQP
jgi:hypothetical protein